MLKDLLGPVTRVNKKKKNLPAQLRALACVFFLSVLGGLLALAKHQVMGLLALFNLQVMSLLALSLLARRLLLSARGGTLLPLLCLGCGVWGLV